MVPIMRLRRTKRTVGVNQLFKEAQIEGMDDTDSSNMASSQREKSEREKGLWSFWVGVKEEDYFMERVHLHYFGWIF